MNQEAGRNLGLIGATGVGVGAIVGGGILALAGVAFAMTGPGAIVAFALNGAIALLTTLSFAEMSSSFPESGGTYTFAKKVLTVQTAFMIGWVVWFASIVASVLYALGFASYGLLALESLWSANLGDPPGWLSGGGPRAALAVAAVGFYTLGLMRKNAGGGQWATVGKLLVFAVLIAGGLWALTGRSLESIRTDMTPFFPGGAAGLFQAMGYTFIALQGFDLIAAVAGEVRDPGRTIPRAMFLSLAMALAVYLPFLLVISTVGTDPGRTVAEMGLEYFETLVPKAAGNFLGPLGYWLVIAAAVLSMLSALQANLFAASRVVRAMALDRTLPLRLGKIHEQRGTPMAGVMASSLAVTVIILLLSDVSAAGAASSLIFLLSFAMAHWTAILARRRSMGRKSAFRVPFFPLVPLTGVLACLTLAVYQGIAVPSAGLIASIWLGIGSALYLALFARRARVFDASAEARDPLLVQLRGRSPLVLVPMANPANAESMVAVAQALAPPYVGKVLLLSVVAAPEEEWERGVCPPQLVDAQAVMRQALIESFSAGLHPEALTTVAPMPWTEINRVARAYKCESLLIGYGNLADRNVENHIEKLISTVDCDVVVLRAHQGFRLDEVRRVLVPVGGLGIQDRLRARILGSLWRTGEREITYLRILREGASQELESRARHGLRRIAQDEVPGLARLEVLKSDDPMVEIVRRADASDLAIMGLQRFSRRRKSFGEMTRRIVQNTNCPVIMISRGD